MRGDGYFYQSDASKLFIDFLLCVLLKSGTRGFFVLARVCSYCAGVNMFDARLAKSRSSAFLIKPKTETYWENPLG